MHCKQAKPGLWKDTSIMVRGWTQSREVSVMEPALQSPGYSQPVTDAFKCNVMAL